MTVVHYWLSLIVLQMGDFAMEGAVWTYMGSNMNSLMGSEVAILAKALACMLVVRGILSTTHSSNRFKESCTFIKYLDMRSSLASYSFCICPTMS